MSEHLERYYQKEEEFLDQFPTVVSVVAQLLGNEWEPNFDCNDNTRRNQNYFLSTGELHPLSFDGAAVYRDENGFSSAQIILHSSDHIVTVAVRKVDGELVAEKIADRRQNR